MEAWQKPVYITSAVKQKYPQIKHEFRETEQVNLCLGVEGLSLFHPDRFAVDLISMILGEGMSSRLFTEIREKLDLRMIFTVMWNIFRDSGVYAYRPGSDPERSGNALNAMLDQLSSMTLEVAETELRKAKEMAKGRLLLGMENSRNVAGWYGGQEILTEKMLTVDDVTQID